MKILIAIILMTLSFELTASAELKVDEVRVYKSRHQMDLIMNGKVIKSFRVSLARGGSKPKRQEGDLLVPEGEYLLDDKNPYSDFYKSIHISYPNDEDIRRAQRMGVEPGGDIMIHGLPNKESKFFKFLRKIGFSKLIDWTAGCIAVDNSEMDLLDDLIEIPTTIHIFH